MVERREIIRKEEGTKADYIYKYEGGHQATLGLISDLAKKTEDTTSTSRACSNRESKKNKHSCNKYAAITVNKVCF